jgi:hypothetical protein
LAIIIAEGHVVPRYTVQDIISQDANVRTVIILRTEENTYVANDLDSVLHLWMDSIDESKVTGISAIG